MKGVGSNNTVVGAYQRMAVSEVGGAKQPARTEQASHEPAPRAAQVSISAEAHELSRSSGGGEVNVQKVSDLKAKIHAGTFHVDSHAVASSMVDRLS
jgi:flagellar biosynthesis anti-sigma factor FlgM